ncbi:MAG: hypothetical protein L7W95_08765 [Alphaproteobacteria bacterium]|nr:hypothetical protein [Alphaproteobacteria bacterium]
MSFFRLEVEIRTINISGQAADIDTGVSVWSVGWSAGWSAGKNFDRLAKNLEDGLTGGALLAFHAKALRRPQLQYDNIFHWQQGHSSLVPVFGIGGCDRHRYRHQDATMRRYIAAIFS